MDAYEKRITFLQKKEAELTEEVEALRDDRVERVNERMELIEFLINSAEKWSATDIREKVIEMIGAKEYIRYKLEHNLNLWELDKELIMTLI